MKQKLKNWASLTFWSCPHFFHPSVFVKEKSRKFLKLTAYWLIRSTRFELVTPSV